MSVDWRTTHWFELLGSWQDTWQDLSSLVGHALVRFIDAPTSWHCSVSPHPVTVNAGITLQRNKNHSRSSEVHCPLAHASPFDPQLFPLGATTSAGHAALRPVHISAVSHWSSLLGRHTCVVGANVHEPVQHVELSGSHTAPFLNLHVDESQHVEFAPSPGSQSSPDSTIPFPHIWSVITGFAFVSAVGALGSIRHDVFVRPPSVPAMREPSDGAVG